MPSSEDSHETPPPQEAMEDVEVDETPPPPRRQHKYTTANLQPERPWKRWLLICLAFLVMIVMLVLLSIFLQKLFDPPEEEDWSDDNVNAMDDDLVGVAGQVSGEAALLPKGAEFLDGVCAEDKINGDAVSRAACADACAPATDCCNPYASANSTCFEEQVAGCVTYSQCHALDGFNDPAHNDLDRVCSMASLALNRGECVNACASMECCYMDLGNCVATNFQACLDYAPCQNLRLPEGSTAEGSSVIEAASSALDDECRNGDGMCARTCREASCCSDQNSGCYRDNFIACLTFAICNLDKEATTRISVAPIHTIVQAAPGTLKDVCLESYVNANGPKDCQEACSAASCCFTDGVSGCFGNDPLGCMEYRMCAIVQ